MKKRVDLESVIYVLENVSEKLLKLLTPVLTAELIEAYDSRKRLKDSEILKESEQDYIAFPDGTTVPNIFKKVKI